MKILQIGLSIMRYPLSWNPGGGGEQLPDPPAGHGYVISTTSAYVVNAGGAYVLAKMS